MTITNPVAAVPDTGPWVHDAFMISMGDTFQSYVEALKYSNASQDYSVGGSSADPVTPADIVEILRNIGPENAKEAMTPLYYAKRKVRDTSLGGNPVINPLPQYNETDDPTSDFTGPIEGSTGMGRVYSSQIDDYQQVLYLQFGTPIFNTLAAFYTGAVDEDTATLNDKGVTYATSYKIGSILGSGLALIQIPTMALESMWRFATYQDAPITSYYDFKNEQLLYYKYVNTILTIITTNMGWMESSTTQRDDGNQADQQDQQENLRVAEQIDAAENVRPSLPGMPDYISKMQMDIGQILHRRMRFLYGSNNTKVKSTDTLIAELQQDVGQTDYNAENQAGDASGSDSDSSDSSSSDSPGTDEDSILGAFFKWKRHFIDGVKMGSDMGNYLMAQYIGFRLETSTDTHESLSNSVGDSEVASTLNSRQQSMREKVFGQMGGFLRNIPVIGGALSTASDAISGAIGGFLSNTGVEGLAQIATGSAMISIPHVWKSSSFSRAYNFEVHLRSVAGDDLSIIQDLYVPFACLFAGGAPRAQGPASYTSPFLVKAYAKGLVTVPMGMITSMSITRGSSQHGWSRGMKPTEMKISFEIQDMTPEMFVSLGSTGWKQRLRDVILGTNNNFMNYLEMLAGLDIHSKLSWQSAQRRFKVMTHLLANTTVLNSTMTGMRVGSFPPLRALNSIVPSSWGAPTTNSD